MFRHAVSSLAVGIVAASGMSVQGAAVSTVPTHDTTILSAQPGNINGGTANHNLGTQGTNNEYAWIIMRWDLSGAVPAGELATGDGSLTLNLGAEGLPGEAGAFDGHIIDMYRIIPANAGWNQSTTNWDYKVTTASTTWSGGAGLGGDTPGLGYDLTPVSSYTWGSPGVDGPSTFSMTVPSSLLNDWLQNPADNAGLLLRTRNAPDGDNRLRIWAAEENDPGDVAPLLAFSTGAIPEPASLGLLAVPATALAMRPRRRAN